MNISTANPHNSANNRLTKAWKAWVVCLTAALFFFYSALLTNCFNAFSLQLFRDLGINATQLGILSASYLLAYVCFLIPAGIILDKYSIKKILLFATGAALFLTLVLSQIRTYREGVFTNFLLGICASICFIAPMKLVKQWFSNKKMGFITGSILALAMLGGMVANLPLMWLTLKVGWRISLICIAGFGLIFFILQWLFISDYPLSIQPTEIKQEEISLRQMRKIIAAPIPILLGIYNSLLNLPLTLFGAEWGVIYLIQVHHLSQFKASFAVMMVFVGMIIGSPALGFIADNILNKKLTLALSAILSLLTIIGLIFLPNLTLIQLVSFIFLLGFFSGSQSVGYAMATEFSPTVILGISLSVVSILVMAGGALMQPFFGYLLNLHWDGGLYNGQPLYSTANFIDAMSIYIVGFAISFIISLFFFKKTTR